MTNNSSVHICGELDFELRHALRAHDGLACYHIILIVGSRMFTRIREGRCLGWLFVSLFCDPTGDILVSDCTNTVSLSEREDSASSSTNVIGFFFSNRSSLSRSSGLGWGALPLRLVAIPQ